MALWELSLSILNYCVSRYDKITCLIISKNNFHVRNQSILLSSDNSKVCLCPTNKYLSDKNPCPADRRGIYSEVVNSIIHTMEKKKASLSSCANKGRNNTSDPATYRYYIRLNSVDNARFLSLLEQSGMTNKSQFIIKRIFEESFKVIKIDTSAMDYYTRLTNLFGQFRAVGVNYNQVVKVLNTNFSENKARALLYKLKKETIQLVNLNRQILDLTREFEEKHFKIIQP